MKENMYQEKIEAGKWLAAVCVIAIHTAPLESISPKWDFALTQILARIAVPYFLMITGYFVMAQGTIPRKTGRYVGKLFWMYGVSTLLYVPVHIYNGYHKQPDAMIRMLKDIVWEGTFYHLWYFPAVIWGILLMTGLSVLLYRVSHKHWEAMLWCLVLLLYGMGLLGDSYYGLIQGTVLDSYFYEPLFQVMNYTRNGLFYVPVFLMMGRTLAKANEGRALLPRSTCIIGSIVSMAAMMAEGMILHGQGVRRHTSMYVCLLPCMFFLFQLVLRHPHWGERKPNTCCLTTEYVIDRFTGKKEMPMFLYILHPLCIVGVRLAAKMTKYDILVTNSVLYFLSVMISTVCVASVLQAGKNHLAGRRRKAGCCQ